MGCTDGLLIQPLEPSSTCALWATHSNRLDPTGTIWDTQSQSARPLGSPSLAYPACPMGRPRPSLTYTARPLGSPSLTYTARPLGSHSLAYTANPTGSKWSIEPAWSCPPYPGGLGPVSAHSTWTAGTWGMGAAGLHHPLPSLCPSPCSRAGLLPSQLIHGNHQVGPVADLCCESACFYFPYVQYYCNEVEYSAVFYTQ